MFNYSKKIISVLLTMVLILGMSLTVYAEDEVAPRLGEVVDGSKLTDNNFVEDIKYNPARGNILNRGVARLSNNEDGTVNIYGSVMAGVVCDKLTLEMTLQRLEGNTWISIKSYSDTSYSSALLTKSYNYSVKSGYYYRIKAACIATKGSTSEYQMPVTNGIWI